MTKLGIIIPWSEGRSLESKTLFMDAAMSSFLSRQENQMLDNQVERGLLPEKTDESVFVTQYLVYRQQHIDV